MDKDSQSFDWAQVGGFEIQDSHTLIEFLDPNGQRVHVCKRQKLVPRIHDASEFLEMDLRSDGQVKVIQCSPGSIELVRRAGVGYQVKVRFTPPLPHDLVTERVFEYDLWDAFLDPRHETYMMHVKRPTSRFSIEFRFHMQKVPSDLHAFDTSFGNPRELLDTIRPLESDRSVWRSEVLSPTLGASYMYEWDW